jgi:hypothetical protein
LAAVTKSSASELLRQASVVTAIHWVLIAVEVVAGVVLTTLGMFLGMWVAFSKPDQGQSPTLRESATIVWFTALYPTVMTLLLGWLGPQPHGSLWLTVLAGIAGAIVGCWLTMVGLAYRQQGFGFLALIGVLLPASCTAFVYNFAWLLPNARFPAIDLI